MHGAYQCAPVGRVLEGQSGDSDLTPCRMPSCAASYDLGGTPTTKEAQAIADELYANFVSEEVDKVEMIYTKFVSLISSDPTVQTLLPLTPQARAAPAPSCLHLNLLHTC